MIQLKATLILIGIILGIIFIPWVLGIMFIKRVYNNYSSSPYQIPGEWMMGMLILLVIGLISSGIHLGYIGVIEYLIKH